MKALYFDSLNISDFLMSVYKFMIIFAVSNVGLIFCGRRLYVVLDCVDSLSLLYFLHCYMRNSL